MKSGDVIAKVRRFIMENEISAKMIKTKNIIVGLSGGADSISLLFILNELRKEGGEYASLNLRAVHVNHCIRGEDADRDEVFSENFCKLNDIPFTAVRVNVPDIALKRKESLEKAARDERYRIFRTEGEKMGDHLIATAHHKNDLAETLIFNISRGTGYKGLIGIRPVNGNIIRPLLGISRREIERFTGEKDLEFVTDSTNEDMTYTRNFIRKEIIPLIEDRLNPELADHLFRISEIASKIDAHIEKHVDAALEEAGLIKDDLAHVEEFKISRYILEGLDDIVLDSFLIEAVKAFKGDAEDLSGERIEALIRAFKKNEGSLETKTLELGAGIRALVNSKGIKFQKLPERPVLSPDPSERKYVILDETNRHKLEKNGSLVIEAEDLILRLEISESFTKNHSSDYTKFFDYDRINTNVFLRKRAIGDWIRLSENSSKKLKKDLIDQKIPREKRDDIWLLTDAGSEVIWAVGVRQGFGSLLRDDRTKGRVLKIAIEKRNGDNNE